MDYGKQKESQEEIKTNKKETNRNQEVNNPSVTISTTVNVDLYKKAKLNSISWKKALEIGICILLNEAKEVGNLRE